jgi:hypothetical protein
MPTKNDQPSVLPSGLGNHYYTELNRTVSVLFAGVIALMTFLLTVGVQRPHAQFAWALYSTIIVLSLNLIVFVVGNIFHGEYVSKAAAIDTEAANAKGLATARRRLSIVRIIQQVLFVIAVGCVAWFAMSAANFFFSIPAQPAQPQ